ncbi:hypothetical protein [Microbacterium nanhaiense]|nr:hypothetical protein [Microbacterium nanhaiense]
MNIDALPLIPSPWRVRRSFPHPVITNVSDHPLALARAIIRVGDDVHTERWGLVLPGDQNEVCLCGLETHDMCVTISWRPSGAEGRELLWQFVA